MYHYYPRNPYRFAQSGYFLTKPPQKMTRGQKWLCGLVWLAALAYMGLMTYQRIGLN